MHVVLCIKILIGLKCNSLSVWLLFCMMKSTFLIMADKYLSQDRDCCSCDFEFSQKAKKKSRKRNSCACMELELQPSPINMTE